MRSAEDHRCVVSQALVFGKAGEQIGSVTRNTTVWLCHLRVGTLDSDFTKTLDDIVSLFSEWEMFMSKFIEEGGEIEISFEQTVETTGNKLFELSLHSWFLKQI